MRFGKDRAEVVPAERVAAPGDGEAKVRNKNLQSFDEAVADVPDGATVMISGFGEPGAPQNLVAALLRQGAKDLVVIANRVGGRNIRDGMMDAGKLIEGGHVKKMVCTINAALKSSMENSFDRMYQTGEIDAELVPQGTFAERIRAGGAGIGGFYTPTGVGTEIAEGKERKTINGRDHILDFPLRADFALIRAHRADTWGNLQFRLAQRNFGPLMAMAAGVTVVEVEEELVEPGTMDPDHVHTPGVYVDRIVKIPPPPEGIWEAAFRQLPES